MSPWLLMTQIAFAQEGPSVEDVPASGEGIPTVVESSTDTDLDALEARLLGELPSDVVVDAAYESNELSGLIWVAPLFVFMIALILWSKVRKATPINPGEIRVISKTPLGKEGSLAVVVVGESNGNEQKMLIGLSEQGAPRLLSVLDATWTRGVTEQDTSSGVPVATADGIPSASATFDEFLSNVQPVSDTEEIQLEARHDLVEELLSARGIDQYQKIAGMSGMSEEKSESESSMRDPSNFEFGEEEDSVVDDDPWVVNFRRKYQQS